MPWLKLPLEGVVKKWEDFVKIVCYLKISEKLIRPLQNFVTQPNIEDDHQWREHKHRQYSLIEDDESQL